MHGETVKNRFSLFIVKGKFLSNKLDWRDIFSYAIFNV